MTDRKIWFYFHVQEMFLEPISLKETSDLWHKTFVLTITSDHLYHPELAFDPQTENQSSLNRIADAE